MRWDEQKWRQRRKGGVTATRERLEHTHTHTKHNESKKERDTDTQPPLPLKGPKWSFSSGREAYAEETSLQV